MKKVVLLLLTGIVFQNTYSQRDVSDSLRFKYTNQTIYRNGSSFMKGNERLTFKDLGREFSMSDLGLDLYLKAKKYKTISKILNYAGLITGIAAIGVLANHGKRDLALGLYGGYFVLFATGMKYSSLSNNTLNGALWQRNKDVLFPPQ